MSAQVDLSEHILLRVKQLETTVSVLTDRVAALERNSQNATQYRVITNGAVWDVTSLDTRIAALERLYDRLITAIQQFGEEF